jgi:hypothetical protein
MWKTGLIICNNKTYISTGLVDKMWKSKFSVENLEQIITLPNIHRIKYRQSVEMWKTFAQVLILLHYLNG